MNGFIWVALTAAPRKPVGIHESSSVAANAVGSGGDVIGPLIGVVEMGRIGSLPSCLPPTTPPRNDDDDNDDNDVPALVVFVAVSLSIYPQIDHSSINSINPLIDT
jgi:hypothetical protein